jgi:hypothetical protein|tara:strand:- start:87 stop:587 length:501 start_codon:yes stop_codon:yes gene_type:complete
MAEALLIGRKNIVKFTSMSGGVDTDKFIQYVKIAQDKHAQGFLGTDLFEAIQAKIIAGNLTGDYLALVNDWVAPALIHWSMVEYLPFAAYTIANKGIYRQSSENADNASKDEVDFLMEKERDTAQYYTTRLIDHLSFNNSKYPEYNSNNNDDVFPDRQANFSGWVL